jgi:sensor histidine kinase regulating citrate/malate metabolism
MGALPSRLLVFSALLTSFAVGMACLLFYFKFENTLANIQRARLIYIAKDVARTVEQGLKPGRALSRIANLPALLAREKSLDPIVTGVDIGDANGAIVHSSDAARVGTPAPQEWTSTIAHAESEWTSRDPDHLAAGVVIRNADDAIVGSVAIRYDPRPLADATRRMAHDLIILFAIVTLLATPLLFGVLMLFYRRFEDHLASAAQALAGAGTASDGLAHEAHAVRERAEGTLAALARAQQALQAPP